MTANRFHDNLLLGYGALDSSRPLDYFAPLNSPRVYGRPTNIRQIVSWRGRLKAAWAVFTLNAVAVKWYDDKNAHTYGRTWHEQFGGPQRAPILAALASCDGSPEGAEMRSSSVEDESAARRETPNPLPPPAVERQG